MALQAINQSRSNEIEEDLNKGLVLDDPFKMKHPINIEQEFQENMEEETEQNFRSRYRTVNENYKSVGSMRSPTAS